MTEQTYEGFILREGNLLDHDRGAIVIASFDTIIGPTGALVYALKERLHEEGWPEDQATSWIRRSREERPGGVLSAAYLLEVPGDPLPYQIILSGYVDWLDSGVDVLERVRLGTKNAVDLAQNLMVESIAFPLLGTRGEGGEISDIVPAMASEFQEDHLQNGPHLEKVLYAYGDGVFDQVRGYLDSF